MSRSRILNNVSWLTLVNIFIKPASFLFIILTTRLLGAEQFGQFMFALALVMMAGVFFEGGIDLQTTRHVAASTGDFTIVFPSSFWLKVAAGLSTLLVAYLLTLFISFSPNERSLILLAGLYLVFNGLLLHFRTYFRAFEIMKYEAYSLIIEKGCVILLCSVVLFTSRSVLEYMVFYILAYGISASATLFILWKKVGHLRFRPVPGVTLNTVLRPALPFGAMNILLVARSRTGTLLIQFLTGNAAWVGFYNAGYRMLEAYTWLPGAITTPLFPVFCRLQERKATLRKLLGNAGRYLWVLSSLVAIPLFLLRKPLTALLFGPGYLPASLAVGLLGLAIIPVSLTYLVGSLVATSGRQTTANKLLLPEITISTLIYFVLIHYHGYTGAAMAALIAECFYLAINIWTVRDLLRESGLARISLEAIVAPLLLLLWSFSPWYTSNLWVLLPVIPAGLISGFVIFGLLRSSDLHLLPGIGNRSRPT